MEIDKKNRVLVVDDNEANTMVLSAMLERLGFVVDEASSGMEAIDHCCQSEYDLIFMDHLMPEMDGIETVKQLMFITSQSKQPVIIGVSATIDEEVTQAFLEAGAKGMLEKPVLLESLEEKLQVLGFASSQAVEEQDSAKQNDIESIVSCVEGLDYQKGIEMLSGNTDSYMQVLAVCIKNIEQNYNSIDLLKGTRQVESFALPFHSLKGIFLNIGADELAECSKELEMAAKEKKLSYIQDRLDEYRSSVQLFCQQLQEAYGKYMQEKQEQQGTKTVSASEWVQNLQILRQHIEDFEYIEITEKLDEMLLTDDAQKKEGLKKVLDAIQDFDYDKALEAVDHMLCE